MANNRKDLADDELALPALDLDDLDDGFDIPEQPKGPVRKFTVNFRRGFLEQTKTRTMLRSFLRGALPDGYSRAIGAGETIWNEGKDTLRQVADHADDDLELIASKTESLLPKLKRFAPKRAYDRIETQLNEVRAGFAAKRDSDRFNTDPHQAAAEEQAAIIRQALAGLDGGQAADSERSDAFAQQRFEVERTERSIYEQAKRGQLDALNRQLNAARGALEYQVTYQDQITYRFQRKSLEMQYRSYFVLRDLRGYADTTKKLHESAYSALVHNTALPEHTKASQAERVRFGINNRGTNMAAEVLSQSLSEYLANYFPQIKENLKNSAVSGIRGLGTLISSGGGFSADMVGRMVGGEASGLLQRFGMPTLSRMARPTMRKFSDRLGGYDHYVNYAMNNASSILQDYAQDLNNTTGWRGMLKNAVRSVVPNYFMDDQIKEGSFQTIDRQAAFNQLTQRSIVDIIPGYLSRLLHETRMMRTGRDDLDREVYDITSGSFTGFKTAKDNARKRVTTEVQRRNINNTLDGVVGAYDTDGDLSPAAQEALRERLLRDAAQGGRFDARKYAAGGYGEDADEATVEELTTFFKNRFEFDNKGRLVRSKENFERMDAYSNAFLELREVIPDPRSELRRIHATGSQEVLRDLGLIESTHGVDRINYDRIWELYRGRETYDPTDPGSTEQEDDDTPPTNDGPSFSERVADRLNSVGDRLSRKVKDRHPRFKSNKDRFKEQWNKRKSDINERVDLARSKFRELKFNPNVFSRFELINGDDLKEKVKDAFTPVGDVYTRLREQPLLLGRDLKAGNYIDVNTGKVIQSLKDVTGEVRNRYGWVVATATDFKDQLHDSTGRALQSNRMTDALNRGQSMAGAFGQGVHQQAQSWAAKARELKDVYLPNMEQPLMLARDIKAGKYFDVNSGERIETLDDITGAVKDVDGNTVLTPEEFEDGLVDQEGRSVKSSQLRTFANRYLSITTAPRKMMNRVLMRAGEGALKAAGNLFKGKDRDAYLPGEEEPRITVQGLKRGQYFDAESGDVLQSFDAIKGAVVDADGNLILSAEERGELVTAGGDKHRAAQGTLRRMLRASTTGLAAKAASGYWNWTKNYYRKLPGRAAKLLTPKPWQAKIKEWMNDDEEEIPEDVAKTPTDGLLKRILKTLDKRLPDEDEPRKGSWKSILARRKAAKEEDQDDEDVQRQGSLLKSLFGGITGLMGGSRWDDEEGDEEDEGDEYYYGEYQGGDKEDKKGNKRRRKEAKRRRKRMNNRGKPKGRLGRLWQGAKNLGKGAWDKVKGLGKSKWGGRLLNAGKSVLGPKGWIARGLMAAGTAVAGVISAPVVIGAAVVGGAAVGGYTYYKKRKRASGVLRELRITQYGFSPNGWSNPGKLLDLEDVLNPAVYHSGSGDPEINTRDVDNEKLFDAVGVDWEDEEELTAFVNWMQNRFKPVFLAYHRALNTLAPEVGLEELDAKLPKEEGMEFLKMVTFKDGENSPYLHMEDPFDPGDTLSIDLDDIKDRMEAVKEHYQEHAKKKEEEQAAGVDGKTTATMAAAGKGKVLKDSPKLVDARKRFEERRKRYQERRGITPDRTSVPGVPGTVLGGGVVTTLRDGKRKRPGMGQRLNGDQSPTTTLPITPNQAIRLRAYGFVDLNKDTVEALMALEDHLFGMMTVQRGKDRVGVSLSLKTKDVFDWWQEAYPNVEVVSGQEGHYRFSKWLNNKVTPVLQEYAYSVLRAGKMGNFATAELDMDAKEKAQIAKNVCHLKVRPRSFSDSERRSIWQTYDHLQTEAPDWQAAADAAETDLKHLEQVAQAEAEKPSEQAKRQTEKTEKAQQRSQARQSVVTRQRQQTGQRPGGSQLPSWYGDGGPMWQQRMPGGQVQMKGNTFQGFSKGNGGVWETIPMPRANKSMEAALPTLQAVAEMTGVDVGIMVTFVSIESAFDYQVTAKTTSATGWFQFINATWDQMLEQHGSKYQLPADDSQRSLRKDPRANALMGAEFLKGNYEIIQKELGRQPSDTDLYLAHFMGAAGAVKFLKQDTNAIAANVFPAPAKANRSIFYKPSGTARTIGEVYQVMDEKVAKHRYGVGSGRDSGRQTANDENYHPGAEAQVANGPMIQVAPVDAPGAFRPASEVGRPPSGRPPTSLAQRTSATVNPLNQSAPSPIMALPQGRPPQFGGGSEPLTVKDPVIQHQTEARRQALAADRRQQVQNAQTVSYSKEMGVLMEKQLKVQESMRDYLKAIAGTVAGVKTEGEAKAGGGSDKRKTTNDTSKRTAPPVARANRTTPLPVNLKE
jgi:hypothetical protein